MEKLIVETDRLSIVEFLPSMAESVCRNSQDEENRRFVPDEVFETAEAAGAMIRQFSRWYAEGRAPKVYAVVLPGGENIGHVQAVPFRADDWEIGYHIAEAHTGKGYATEAVRAFLPAIMRRLAITKMCGVCLAENFASRKVLERCGFALEFEGEDDYQGERFPVCRYVYSIA